MPFEIDHAAGYLLYAWGAFAKSNWRPRPADFQGRYIELSTHAAIPLRLPNLQRLHAAGLDVPPPLEVFGYDWPGRVKPYTAQIITANMLVLNPLCYVLNEMRTGKTLSALWAADFLMRQYPGSRCLILSNLSTVRDVWQTTILEHFLGRRTCVVLHAHDDKARFKRLAADVDFYIGNHDILRQGVSFERKNNKRHIRVQGLMGEVVRRVDIGLVIVDEASAFKNSLTNRSLAGRKILSGKPVRWPMTGSPTPQAPTDIHGLQRLVDPAYINRFDHVRNLLMEPEDEWRWKPKEGAYELAAQLLRPAVRFRAVDCFDAPEQTVTHRRALLSDEQKKKLRELKEQALTLLRQADGVVSRVSAANAGVLRAKSLQICSGAVYDEQGRAHRLDCSDRLNVLSEVVEQAAGDKIILLAPFTSVLHMLYSHVGESSAVFVDGSVSAQNRTDAITDFLTNPKKQFLVAQPEVLKFGLDLSAASIIVWFSPVDKTETWIQANRRICGPKQKKPTLVVCLSSHRIEDMVYERLQNHQSMQDVFLALVEANGVRGR